ncbi:MAG: dihydroorotase [Candidatus Thermoplasmatota archaeon]
MELVLEGMIFTHGEFMKGCIGIDNGKIVDIKKILKGDKNFDFGDKLLLPGGIDIHVHFREPPITNKEDFYTGSLAAARGGVTCVFDMPNTLPPVITKNAFFEKIEKIKKKANVDYALYSSPIGKKFDVDYFDSKTPFKIYLAPPTPHFNIEEEEFGVLSSVIKNAKTFVGFHAEEQSLFSKKEAKNLVEYESMRGREAEVSGIKKAIEMSGEKRIHICHLSTKDGFVFLKDKNVTKEVTPHHLFLNKDMNLKGFGKVNPPLRTKEDSLFLLEEYTKGNIEIIASDHAPHTIEEKSEGFSDAPAGIPGVETMYPLFLSLLKHSKIHYNILLSSICEKPGEICYSLYNVKKGKIEKGYDADIIVVDMRKEEEIKEKEIISKCGWTPFKNHLGIFPKYTFLRGIEIISEFEVCETCKGKWLGGEV